MDKRKNIYIVFFIITTIIASCLAVYFKIDGDKKLANSESEVKTETVVKEVEKVKNIGVTNFYLGSVAIVSEGNVYVNISNNVYSQEYLRTNLYKENISQYSSVINNYTEYNFEGLDYCQVGNSPFKGMKLNVTGVDKVYINEEGQMLSGSFGLILLNKDKTISIISLYSLIKGKTDVKKVEGLSDINSIVKEDYQTFAVKSNGEKVNLKDYIPEDFNQF